MARLVVEVDGSHHFTPLEAEHDRRRGEFLEQQGLRVLRFDDRQVLLEVDAVVEDFSGRELRSRALKKENLIRASAKNPS